MTRLTVGVVNYGVGNHASVRQCLQRLDIRCRVSDDRRVLEACHLVLLPGVGAFRPAREALQRTGLDGFVIEQAKQGKPVLGVCLGMQLLTEASHEGGFTEGLGLIPGQAVPLGTNEWHIGWNTIDPGLEDPLMARSVGRAFFFNHSCAYEGPAEFQIGCTRAGQTFGSVIRRGNVVGVQFHPEKSQDAGRALLHDVITGLCHA